MDFHYRYNYDSMSDKEIVNMIITPPHNEEAAIYLVDKRYSPLLRKIYFRLTSDSFWYDDCVDELIIHLRGKEINWQPLASFEWRSTFGGWLKKTVWNNFKETLDKLIEKEGRTTSIDEENPEKPKIQLADGDQDDDERRHLKVLVMEGIRMLEDEDQRFVMLRRLEGYSSKETAILLQMRWERHGIKKYNNKNELVIPDHAYVNVRVQRAKDNLKSIIPNIK